MISNILVNLVALIHLYIVVLEMFLWTKPLGLKVFRNKPEFAEASKVLAANQGLYNGFLSAGLIWALVQGNSDFSFQTKIFFLACVIVAGIYGTWSVSKRIFYVQALPAILALAATLFSI